MAKGTVYLYFKSKEEVFAAVLARDLERLTDQTIEGDVQLRKRSRSDSPSSRTCGWPISNIIRTFLNIYFAEFGSRGSRSTLISGVIDKLYWRGVDFMRQCLEQAIAQEEIPEVPVESAAFAIYDLARIG